MASTAHHRAVDALTWFFALCTAEPLTEEQAKAVGALAARADHDDIVDVVVVEGAVRRRDAVVTSNPTHIARLPTPSGFASSSRPSDDVDYPLFLATCLKPR